MEAFSNLRVQTGLLNEVAKTLYVRIIFKFDDTSCNINTYVIYVQRRLYCHNHIKTTMR